MEMMDCFGWSVGLLSVFYYNLLIFTQSFGDFLTYFVGYNVCCVQKHISEAPAWIEVRIPPLSADMF